MNRGDCGRRRKVAAAAAAALHDRLRTDRHGKADFDVEAAVGSTAGGERGAVAVAATTPARPAMRPNRALGLSADLTGGRRNAFGLQPTETLSDGVAEIVYRFR